MPRKFALHLFAAAMFAAIAAGMFPAVPAHAASSGGVTKGAFVQRYFLDKLKRPPAARKYVPSEVDKLDPRKRYEAVAKSLANKGVMTLLGTKPDQPLSRVEYITLTYLLAGGAPGKSFAQQKEVLKERGVLDKADIGHIKAFQGDITVTRDGKNKAIKLTGAEPVLFRDLDETDFGARLELQLDDGSVLTIGEDTALKIDEMIFDPKTNRRSISLRVTVGTIRVKVSKNKAPGSRFRVLTPTTVTGVRGTEFTVSVNEEGVTRVITLEGSVAVRPVGKNERRPTSKAEQEQGAPAEQGTEDAGDEPTGDGTSGETLVNAGESTEVSSETTTVETTTATDEEIQQVTEATEVTEPTQTASVSTADTQATDDIVQVETTESTADTVDTNQETSEQTDTAALEEDLGAATEEVTTTGSVGDSALTTSSTPTAPADLTGLSGATLKSTFLGLTAQQQADSFGALTTAQQRELLSLLTQAESEALLARFKPDTSTLSFTTAALKSLLDFGAAASAKQVGYTLDNFTPAQAAAYINCDGTIRSCVGDNDKQFFTDSTQGTFTAFGLDVANSLDVELSRLADAGGTIGGKNYILASAGGGGISLTPKNFRVADEVIINLDDLPDSVTLSTQGIVDIWGGGLTPTNYSVNGGYQAGQLRSTFGGGSNVSLIDTSSRVSALNNNGFLSYAVQAEEDIVNTAVLAIRATSSGTFISGTLTTLVNTQIDLSNIRARDGVLALQMDARAGLVLQGSAGKRVRVQQYIYRPPSNTDEVRMTSISLASTDLTYQDVRAKFQSGGLSGKSALQIRNLQWADYFTFGFTDTVSNCESISCSAAVISPGGSQPLLDTLSMEMGNGAGDYVREKLVLQNSTTAAIIYKFDGTSLGSVNFQKVTFMELSTRKTLGGTAKFFTLDGSASPVVYKPHSGSTLGGGAIASGEFRIIPRINVSGASTPPSGHPDGFYYVANDSGTTRNYPIEFAVVGDATSSTNISVRSVNCGSSGAANCGSISFDNIWSALAVNQPSGQGPAPANIGANILEITAKSNGELSSNIRTYLIPWPRMIWRGEGGF